MHEPHPLGLRGNDILARCRWNPIVGNEFAVLRLGIIQPTDEAVEANATGVDP
jgi:hypothetical protein